MRCRHEMPFGAQMREGGGVDFRLWAPAARQAELVFHPSAGGKAMHHPAQADREGWWSCFVPEAAAGSLYQWRLDGRLLVPDPASRHNPRGVHEASAVVDPLQFEWDADWVGRPWHDAVIYELHVGAFTPEGTFAAACERLGELADLGITAVQLMPVASFPGRFGWGYDGVLPFAPKERYGTPDEFKRFIQEAHRRELMVFLDVVYNHFGPDGNFLASYAPAFFSEKHHSPWGAAINFDGDASRTVREFFIHNAIYWVNEFRIDGLRLDAVHAIVDASRPHVLEELSERVRLAAEGRHVHLIQENERNEHRYLSPLTEPGRYDGQWNDDFHHALHVALTGETHGYYHDYGRQPLDLLARALSDGMLFEGSERHPGGARKQVAATPPQWLPALVNFAQNHDQVGNRAHGERLSQLVAAEAAPLATLLAILTPAVPMLFFGEEFGAAEPFLYFADWDGELREAVRRGRKAEFGHDRHEADTPLPDPCGVETFEASRPDASQGGTPAGVRHRSLIKSAIEARRRWIVPRQSLLAPATHSAQRIGASGIAVQWRYQDGRMLALELNLGPDPVTAPAERHGPVEAETVFAYRRGAGTPDATWPAWSALWTLGMEITQ